MFPNLLYLRSNRGKRTSQTDCFSYALTSPPACPPLCCQLAQCTNTASPRPWRPRGGPAERRTFHLLAGAAISSAPGAGTGHWRQFLFPLQFLQLHLQSSPCSSNSLFLRTLHRCVVSVISPGCSLSIPTISCSANTYRFPVGCQVLGLKHSFLSGQPLEWLLPYTHSFIHCSPFITHKSPRLSSHGFSCFSTHLSSLHDYYRSVL